MVENFHSALRRDENFNPVGDGINVATVNAATINIASCVNVVAPLDCKSVVIKLRDGSDWQLYPNGATSMSYFTISGSLTLSNAYKEGDSVCWITPVADTKVYETLWIN